MSSITLPFLKLGSDSVYREELQKKVVIQDTRFSWEKSAEEVLDIYNRAMTLPKFAA